MTINKLSVYCEVNNGCWEMAFYPPVKVFSANPTNELFRLDIIESSPIAGSSVWSLDGLEYMTLPSEPSPGDFSGSFTLYYGSDMTESCDLFNCSTYSTPSADNPFTYYAHIDTNFNDPYISFPSLMNSVIFNTLVVFVDAP